MPAGRHTAVVRAEYDLQDSIVYRFYGHKREHCAQINVFRDQVDGASDQ